LVAGGAIRHLDKSDHGAVPGGAGGVTVANSWRSHQKAWWQKHQTELQVDVAQRSGPQTIAVDGAARFATEPAG